MHATIFWQQTAIWTTAGKATKRHSRKGNVIIARSMAPGKNCRLPGNGLLTDEKAWASSGKAPRKKRFLPRAVLLLAVPVYIDQPGAARYFFRQGATRNPDLSDLLGVMPDSLKAAWKLRCRQYDAKGELLSNELVSTEYHPELDISLPLASSAHLLSWQPEIGGIPAAKAVELRIVCPGNFPENPAICGNRLLVSGRRAVLRCDPLQDALPVEAEACNPEVPMKLYYFDDGLGNTYNASKGASGSGEPIIFRMKGFSAGRILLPEIPAPAGIAGIAALPSC